MTDSRWPLVETILNGAIELTGDARAKYVRDACKGDSVLQAEVESLLGHGKGAESFLETPRRRTSLQGLQHARYEILEPIGRGGMGEVYKARDGQLDRIVAVKAIGPEHGLSDAIAKRLSREARFGASLDHPFICKVHELIQLESGETLLVMEFVEGETLKQLLERGPLSAGRAAKLGGEIAEAIGFAHASGVIHRDLKPANVMVTPHEHVKVMDFGIARLLRPAEETATDLTGGRIIGTPAYMSPEQAAGRPLDLRSDIYSFGLLLYECLTGTLPPEDPAARWPTATTGAAPANLRAIVNRCLERQPQQRAGSFDEIQAGLERAATILSPAVSAGPFWKTRRFLLEVSAIVAVIAAGWGYTAWRAAQAEPALVMLSQEPIVTWATAEFGSRVSPDGATVSFISSQNSQQRIWMRSVQSTAGSEPRPITEPTAEIRTPTWSNDGKKIAYLYRSNDKPWLRIISIFGESVVADQLIDVDWNDVALVRWIGNHIYFSRSTAGGRGKLWRCDTETKNIIQITHQDGPAFGVSGSEVSADVSSDEKRLVFVTPGGRQALMVSDIDGRHPKALGVQGTRILTPRWSGLSVVYVSNENGQFDIWQVSVATAKRSPLTTSPLEEKSVDVSGSGHVIVADTVDDTSHLWSMDIADPKNLYQLTSDDRKDRGPSVTDLGEIVFQRSKGAFGTFSPFDSDLVAGRLSGNSIEASRILDAGFGAEVDPAGGRVLYMQETDAALSLWLRTTSAPGVGTRVWERLVRPIVNLATGAPLTKNVAWSKSDPNGFYFVGRPAANMPAELFLATAREDLQSDVHSLGKGRTVEDRFGDLAPAPVPGGIAFVRTLRGTYQGGTLEFIPPDRAEPTKLLSELKGTIVRALGWLNQDTLVFSITTLGGDAQIGSVSRAGHRQLLARISGVKDVTTFELDSSGGRVLTQRLSPRGFCQIVSVSLATGRITPLVSATQAGVSYGGFSVSGNGRLIYVLNETAQNVWTFVLGSAK